VFIRAMCSLCIASMSILVRLKLKRWSGFLWNVEWSKIALNTEVTISGSLGKSEPTVHLLPWKKVAERYRPVPA
jgi:hypothetical protein